MKLLFIHVHPFYREGDKTYSSGSLTSAVWLTNYLPYFDHITVIGRLGCEKHKQVISSVDGKVDFVLIPGLMKPMNYFLHYLKIKKIITEEIRKADVAAIRLPSIFGNIAIPVLRKEGKPFFVEQVGNAWEALWNHSSVKGKLCAHFFHWMNKKRIRKAPYAVYVASKLQRDYPTRGHATVISNVIIPGILSAGDIRLTRFNNEVMKIGLIGGFSVRFKGQDVLLKAVSLLDERIKKNIELYFAGVGDYSWLSKLAGQLGLGDHIKFMGPVPHDGIFKFLENLSLYVQPSITEGMPRAMLEAMSQGCPALGSTIGGIPDVLEPGLLHKPGDYKRLAGQIKMFYDDRDYLLQQARLSLERVAPFAERTLTEKRSKFFRQIINDAQREI
jgi:glycosyltransferase involved in cell wall biosynthesis